MKRKLFFSGVLVLVVLLLVVTMASQSASANAINADDSRAAYLASSTDHVNQLAPTAVIIVGGNITFDTTWTAGNIYVVLSQDIAVNANATLTIEAGAIVKFNLGRSLLVSGVNSALRVLGTADNPVYLTSIATTRLVATRMATVELTTPARGDWIELQFADLSNDAASLIDHALLRYGGGATCCGYCTMALSLCSVLHLPFRTPPSATAPTMLIART